MALFDSVPRGQYELLERQLEVAVADRRAADARYEALVAQMVDMKRHEAGLHPSNWKAPADIFDSMPRTRLAIDMFAQGDVELTRHLEGKALLFAGKVEDPDEKDERTADYIMRGDE